MDVKIWVLDRIEQTFNIFKNNFMDFFLPLFLYNLISVVIFWTILMSMFFSNLWNITNWSLDFFTLLNNPYVVIAIAVWIISFIVYLMLYIPILLWLIKSIKQAYEWDQVTVIENLFYWFSRLTDSFKTYWYIFAYIALIPSLFFILGWILFNAWFYIEWQEKLKQVWWILMIVWWILFVVFLLYRWIKASFSIYSAVNHDSFKKDDFLNSINITNNNWWRIVWNFFLMGLIILLVSWLIWWLFKIFSYNWIDYTSIRTLDDIMNIVWEFSITTQILSGFINNILNTIWTVFIIIFTYLFFLRLKNEANNITSTWKIEL